MILFYYRPPGCVHIVDPHLDSENPLLPAVLREYAANSRVELISPDISQNKIFFLSEETGSSWCYYYEKASLAAEAENWEQVADLAKTAFTIDDHPDDASERFPFIEGFARASGSNCSPSETWSRNTNGTGWRSNAASAASGPSSSRTR